jgi:WD40 repeat protein
VRDAEPSLDELPSRIGRYRVVRKLGEGGMGIVFEAEQQQPRRRVAVKVVKPHLSARHLRRFRLEGEVLGRLRHPGIASIYEAGAGRVSFPSGASIRQPFLAMELVDGEPVSTYAATLDVPGRLALVATICEIVQYAHRRGVIHRDLKPGNVLVETNAQPKILDFGVARAVDPAGERDYTTQTRMGEIIGTLPYMSPEQLGGDVEAIDTQSDVYALGIILYEVLTGRHPYPFEKGSLAEISARLHATGFAPPSKYDKSCRGDIDVIVATAIEDEKERRYQSAGALATDIRRHLRLEPIEARADSAWYVVRRQVQRHRLPVAIGASFLFALVAFAVVSWTLYVSAERARQDAEQQHAEATSRLWDSYLASARLGRSSRLPGRRLASLDVIAKASAIRPSPELRDEAIASLCLTDLRVIAELDGVPGAGAVGLDALDRFSWIEHDSISIVSELPSRARIATLPGPGRTDWVQRFSPDGRFLASRYAAGTDRLAIVWEVDRERPVLTIEEGRLAGMAVVFDPRSKWVAFAATDSTIRIHDLPSGALRETIAGTGAATLLAVHPGGERIATSDGSSIGVWQRSTGGRLLTSPAPSYLYSIGYTPDGRWLAGTAADGGIYLWDTTTGAMARRLEGHSAPATVGFFGANELLATRGWDGTTRTWDLRRDVPLFDPIEDLIVAGMAGERMLFQGPNRNVVVMEIARAPGFEHITDEEEFRGPSQVALSADGRYLATAADNGLHLWSLATGESMAQLAGRARDVLIIGGDLFASVDRELLRWPLRDLTDGGRAGGPTPVAPGTTVDFIGTHPDGRSVAAIGADRFFLIAPGTGAVGDMFPLPDGAEHPQLTPDGRWLFLSNWRGPGGHVIDAATGEIRRVFPGTSVTGAFSPDGTTLIVTDPEGYRLVDVASLEDRIRVTRPERVYTGKVAFHPKDEMVAVTYSRYVVWLLDVETGERLCTLRNPDPEPITSLQFTLDGNRLIAVATGRDILIWKLDEIRRRLRELDLDWGRSGT